MNEVDTLKRLSFENIIWVVFIVISLLDIYGDELIKKSIIENDNEADIMAKYIFLGIIIISIIIYIYFFIRNYNDFINNSDNNNYRIRFIGSLLVLIGTILLLYFQLMEANPTDGISNI